MGELLLEIGVEELPARFIEPAKEAFASLLRERLKASRLSAGDIIIMATPRRLATFVKNLSPRQTRTVSAKYGPPKNRAFDEEGVPTKAALGFAKSQGVTVNELKIGVKDNVEFVTVEKIEEGKATKEILPVLLRDVISQIPFPKKMRWGSEVFEFARPIQWVLCLFGRESIRFSVADVTSGHYTHAHRFLSKGAVKVSTPSEYVEQLRSHHVIVDEQERMKVIEEGIRQIENEVHGQSIRDEGLLKEILYLTEYPYPLNGNFDDEFLLIPKEVLINVMKSHQRYIPIQKETGELMPHFICFANTIPVDANTVIRGNEKVLKARLADARFFFQEDRKVGLKNLSEKLSSVTFHVRLGTMEEKTKRIEAIALYLAKILGYNNVEKIKKTVRMIKADLLTHMVREFPELQGTMGRIYALHEGEDEEIAYAIEEHYLPSGSNGLLPENILSTIIGIADKIDSLTSFFSAGITPTGNLDPFALRRQALGIIKMVVEKRLHVPLKDLIGTSYSSGESIQGRLSFEETLTVLLDFIAIRFKFLMIEERHNQDFVESVLPFVSEDIYDAYLRLIALETQKTMKDFERLMIGFKRVYNITKTVSDELTVNPALFGEPEEERLYKLYESTRAPYSTFMKRKDYDEALSLLVGFKETIDNYFDKVFVMVKDDAIRMNRLALLKKVKDMFLQFGDFSKIRIE